MPHGGECSRQERGYLQYGRVTQHRDPGGCLFISLPRVTNPRFSSHKSSLFGAPSIGAQSGYKQNFLHWPFKRVPMFLVDSCLYLTDRILIDFHRRMLCGCPFPALPLLTGEPSLGLRPHASQGKPSTAEMSLWNLSHPSMGVGPALFVALCFPPVSTPFLL